MRVTTDFWVSALLRRVFSAGGFGAVLRRGGDSAGAVFLIVRDRMGESALYGPAPQTGYDDAHPDERLFTELFRSTDADKVSARLEREQKFDSDLWVVEIEPGRDGAGDLFAVMTP